MPLLAAVLILAALIWAYGNAFAAPFVFDDRMSIVTNLSIRHLSALGRVLHPDPAQTTCGRPLLNLSFAANYAAGGLDPVGYHAVNLALHTAGAMLLYYIVAYTLGRRALAAAVAALWALQPVQTASVTYVSQRAEVLMGLCLLAMLAAFVRALRAPRPAPWLILSAACCWAGMAAKETMVAAPALILLYDAAFASGGFRAALRARPRYYAVLAASWVLLAALALSAHWSARGIGAGSGVSPGEYALAECRGVAIYLARCLWPAPLIFDYGPQWAQITWKAALPFAALIAALIATSVFAWRRGRRGIGFCGLAFFLLLIPTSSIIPLAGQPIAENRVYLPLAAVAALVACGLHRLRGRAGLALAFTLAGLCAVLTHDRNGVYRTELGLWRDTAAKVPASPRAWYNLGCLRLAQSGGLPEALADLSRALALEPTYAEAHNNYGNALLAAGAGEGAALAQYQAALEEKPAYADAHYNLANLLARDPGQAETAIAQYRQAIALDPALEPARLNLANTLARAGRAGDAIPCFQAALRLDPDDARAHLGLGAVLFRSGRTTEAIAETRRAVELDPSLESARRNLAAFQRAAWP